MAAVSPNTTISTIRVDQAATTRAQQPETVLLSQWATAHKNISTRWRAKSQKKQSSVVYTTVPSRSLTKATPSPEWLQLETLAP